MPDDGGFVDVKLYRETTEIGGQVLTNSNGDQDIGISITDTPPAGTYTYYLKATKRTASNNGIIDESLMVIEEDIMNN